MKRTATLVGYTVVNFRYAQLVLPAGVATFLLGSPPFMVAYTVALLVLAVAAELFASAVQGIETLEQIEFNRQYMTGGFDSLADYLSGEKKDGSEQEAGPEEGGPEAGREEGPAVR